MSRAMRFLCGNDESECTGSLTQTSPKWKGSHKAHSSRKEAFDCRVRSLLKQGYERVNTHDFRHPEGLYTITLPRVSRFGGELRGGKEGRFMPDKVSGVIINK